MKLHIALYETLVERVWFTDTPIGVHKELQWVSQMSSVSSPPSPPSPISESIRMHLPNMERLTGLNCKDWLHNWRLVLSIAGKLHLTEYPIPVPPEQVIIKGSYDKHNLLVDESEEIRDLMLLTIDPEFCKDFESLGPYKLMQLIEAYIGELYKLGYSMSQEKSVNILLASLTSKYDLFIQTYRKEDQKRTLMEMRPLLTLYESLLDRHSSNGSTTSRLSPVKRCNKKRSRSSGHVSSWESTKSDTVTERLEDAPNLLKAQGIKKALDSGA
ncbi:hypothetical protein L2E82_08682 [Cichorium intybus]|uniref:Uncharacterized protein n=1 Tax=Cichorium intybus TaxID=13427 RepID=A0ACB9G7X8_CICIN|nr:hypothetical protein L2E82_08682 [Cichorium intybus]